MTAAAKKPAASIYLDEKGVPISVYGVIRGQHVGEQRSIVAVAEKGLDYWNRLNPDKPPVLLSYSWEDGRDLRTADGLVSPVSAEEGMLNCADWLLENVDRRDGYAVWRYAYPSFYGTKVGWRCAHAQGQAIQLMLRAHDATGLQHYLDCAMIALKGYFIKLEDGGFMEHVGSNHSWYHKFADVECERPFVLNGMLFALLGLIDLHRQTGCDDALLLLKRGVDAVEDRLNLYDQGTWSSYNVMGTPASRHYHEIHCRQLSQLCAISPNEILSVTLDRWNRGDVSGATGGKWERR